MPSPFALCTVQAPLLLSVDVDLLGGTFQLASSASFSSPSRTHATGSLSAVLAPGSSDGAPGRPQARPSHSTVPSGCLTSTAARLLAWLRLINASPCSAPHSSGRQAMALTAHPRGGASSAFLVHHPAAVDASFQLGAVREQPPGLPSAPLALKVPSGVACFLPLGSSDSVETVEQQHACYGAAVLAGPGAHGLDSRLLPGVAVSGVYDGAGRGAAGEKRWLAPSCDVQAGWLPGKLAD